MNNAVLAVYEHADIHSPINAQATPQQLQYNIKLTRLTGFDYVFLNNTDATSAPLNDGDIMHMAFQLIEELQLPPEHCVFISSELNNDEQVTYTRHEIQWVDAFPVNIKTSPIRSRKQAQFIQTMALHSTDAVIYRL